jgi:sterol desaturase/sphingolipid hydroxylase (fatty acid hydroxylase superfamily)
LGHHRLREGSLAVTQRASRRLQHRLHYDHRVKPNRLDLLFGVSNPALDGVFGTFRGPGANEKSAIARKLLS